MIGIKSKFILLTPTTEGEVPAGSLFLHQDTNVMNYKSSVGDVSQVSSSAISMLVKKMQCETAITAMRPVSKLANGKITFSDSDNSANIVGFALSNGNIGDIIDVLCIGANLIDAIAGLGYAVGDTVYMSEDGNGYTNNPSSFTGNNDSIVKIGIADCKAGLASTVATDLILFPQIIMNQI
ncbi:MAG: hypothetical protein ACXVCY_04660 [Pseudobdellovibrionaceae bacterium]